MDIESKQTIFDSIDRAQAALNQNIATLEAVGIRLASELDRIVDRLEAVLSRGFTTKLNP